MQPSGRTEFFWPRQLVRKWLQFKPTGDDFRADHHHSDHDSLVVEDEEYKSHSLGPRSNRGSDEVLIPKISVTIPEHADLRRSSRPLIRGQSETLRKQYVDTKEYRIAVGTWNVAGKPPPEELDLDEWLDGNQEADIYVLGFQEIVPLNAGNVLCVEDEGPAAKWDYLIREALNNKATSSTQHASTSAPQSPYGDDHIITEIPELDIHRIIEGVASQDKICSLVESQFSEPNVARSQDPHEGPNHRLKQTYRLTTEERLVPGRRTSIDGRVISDGGRLSTAPQVELTFERNTERRSIDGRRIPPLVVHDSIPDNWSLKEATTGNSGLVRHDSLSNSSMTQRRLVDEKRPGLVRHDSISNSSVTQRRSVDEKRPGLVRHDSIPDSGMSLKESSPRNSGMVRHDSIPENWSLKEASPRNSGLVRQDSIPENGSLKEASPRNSGLVRHGSTPEICSLKEATPRNSGLVRHDSIPNTSMYNWSVKEATSGPAEGFHSFLEQEESLQTPLFAPSGGSQTFSRDSSRSKSRFSRIASKQMVGLFITVWVRAELRRHVHNVKVSCVGCGLMGYLGNKGSISVSMSLHETSFCFTCSHLTSGHKEGDEYRRNSDVAEILRRTTFPRESKILQLPETIMSHDCMIWLGDLNYRLAMPDHEARSLVAREDWETLLEKDQLRIEQNAGHVFDGWQEGPIYFPPTYKYVFNSDRYSGESVKPGEKRRTPAWCDRILWLGKALREIHYMRTESKLSDHRPVSAAFIAEVEHVSRHKLKRVVSFASPIPNITEDISPHLSSLRGFQRVPFTEMDFPTLSEQSPAIPFTGAKLKVSEPVKLKLRKETSLPVGCMKVGEDLETIPSQGLGSVNLLSVF